MKKVELEFLINCSPKLLYSLLSTPSGLAEWFADRVNERNGEYTFQWGSSDEKATLIAFKEPEFVRYQWDYADEGNYFELRITVDELTNDVALLVTDHCEPGEEKETEQLWERQIQDLMHSIGA